MRFLILFLSISFFSSQLHAQDAWTDRSRILPDLLRKVPVGLTLWHGPNPVYPTYEEGRYIWQHSTSVRAEVADLTIVASGSFIWYGEAGWIANMDLTTRQFAKSFDCPKGRLKQGQTYTFEANNRYGKEAFGGDALWYVIAEDKNGKRYKGMGLIETEE